MDPVLLVVLSAFGAILLFLLTITNARLKKIGDTLVELGIANAELRAILLGVNGSPGLVRSVSELQSQWQARQREELDEATAEIARLNRERRQAP